MADATVARAWRRYGVKPWRRETFKFSTDPELEAKVRDVVGLYLDPPEKAVVLCVDEKSQIQALDRTAPILPLRPGLPEKATHDYVRHGTTTLFAALEVATGKVTDGCYDRHRHEEFLHFLKKVARSYPRRELHIVVDNYRTHKHPDVQAWLEAHPRITLHFTPTSGSWLNMVEVFFSIITRQAIRRGTFRSVKDLVGAISRFIEGLERPLRTLCLDQDRRSDPAPRHPSTNFRRAALGAQAVAGELRRVDVAAPRVGLVAPGQDGIGDAPVGADLGVVPRHSELVVGVVVAVDQVPQEHVGERGEAVGHAGRDEQAAVLVAVEVDAPWSPPRWASPTRRSWSTTRARPRSTYQ